MVSCLVASVAGVAQNATLITIFTNPTPANLDLFGNCIASAGSGRVLIGANADDTGAPNAGAAYLFTTDGTLLTTFTNPTPANGEGFGGSMAMVGSDRVLISAPYDTIAGAHATGAAYLYDTNGTLLTTFTSPKPGLEDAFGISVAALGSDRVLICANGDSTGAAYAGAAYLFNTNGTMLTTITNPTPAVQDYFGGALAIVGSDRLLIGTDRDNTGATDAGAAYLFNTNGTLLTTFTNPAARAGHFGNSVAALGNDRVLIAAYFDGSYGGAAYLFSTSGTLLTTFTNPTPALQDYFGWSVAAVGSVGCSSVRLLTTRAQ